MRKCKKEQKLAQSILRSLKVRGPGHPMNNAMVKTFETERYEFAESIALGKHLYAGNRMLELGAGCGADQGMDVYQIG